MTEFLPKNPEKAIVEIKEKLYTRLEYCKKMLEIKSNDMFDAGYDRKTKDEVNFLENLLDIIERS